MKHTSVIHVLKILEKQELIYKEPPCAGSKSNPIYLTEKGSALARHFQEGMQKTTEIMYNDFSESEKELLDTLPFKLYCNLEQEGGITTQSDHS